jgi:cytochrome P450
MEGQHKHSSQYLTALFRNMCHDEWHYKFPHKFDPDRFRSLINVRSERTQESNRCSTASLDPKNIIFGFGRRVCPGEYLADAILWTAMTSILANYDILPEIDGTTREPVVPEEKFTSGSLRWVLFVTPIEAYC